MLIGLLFGCGKGSEEDSTSYTGTSLGIVGIMRDEVKSLLNCEFAYFTGTSGNVQILHTAYKAEPTEEGAAVSDINICIHAGNAR